MNPEVAGSSHKVRRILSYPYSLEGEIVPANRKKTVLYLVKSDPSLWGLLQGHIDLLKNRLRIASNSSDVNIDMAQKDPSLKDVLTFQRDIAIAVTFTDPDPKLNGEALAHLIAEKVRMTYDRQ